MKRLPMPYICLLLALANIAYAGELPNPAFTPGVARDVTKEQLCTTSTKLVRHTTAQTKTDVYAEYGITPRHALECTGPGHACYEIDHVIALEIGGADVKENLWPQEYEVVPTDPTWQKNGAHLKDSLENRLHKNICDGTTAIADAQACIATDWIKCYARVMP